MSIANSIELGMLALINGARGAAGLEPLRLITLLNQAAEAHSAWMLQADTFGHDGEDGTSPADRMAEAGYPFEGASLALENIGWQSARGDAGYDDDIAQIHESLMASPEHRANILNPEVRDIGIGVETGTFPGLTGEVEAVMVTQVFGATDADISAWIDPGTVGDDAMPEEDVIAEDDGTEDPVMEEAPSAEDVVTEDDANEDIPDDMTDPSDDMADSDPDVPDDDEIVMENDSQDDEDPAEDDMVEDDPEVPEGEDVVMEDDTDDPDGGMGMDDPAMPTLPHVALPCGLEAFTVDLSEAFEFRKEGDQYIWETSEEKLIDAFLTAFEDWAGMPGAVEGEVIDVMAEDDESSLDECLFEDLPALPVEPLPADDLDEDEDWDLLACA